MGDTFLFSLGGIFLIIFHQYLYGWNFLILSWVAFSYGWHFYGALFKFWLDSGSQMAEAKKSLANELEKNSRGYKKISLH